MVGCFPCLFGGRNSQRKRLLEAAKQGDEHAVAGAVALRPDLVKSATFLRRKTALHLAAEEGHLPVLASIVETLLCQASSADASDASGGQAQQLISEALNARDAEGRTPLVIACGMGHVECVRFLLANGADRMKTDTRGNSPLHYAAAKGMLGVMFMLLAEVLPDGGEQQVDQSVVDIRNDAGFTPLHFAVWGKQSAAVQVLLQHDADVIARSTRTTADIPFPPRTTPLHLAAARGHVEISRLLLKTYYERVVQPGQLNRAAASAQQQQQQQQAADSSAPGGGPAASPSASSPADAGRGSSHGAIRLSSRSRSSPPAPGTAVVASSGNNHSSNGSNRGVSSSSARSLSSSPAAPATSPQSATAAQAASPAAQAAAASAELDPRLQANAAGHLPYMVAVRLGFFALATLLRPSIPIERLFTEEDRNARLYGPPQLKVLATEALNKRLLASLESTMEALSGEKQQQQPALPAAAVPAGAPAAAAAAAAAGTTQQQQQQQHGCPSPPAAPTTPDACGPTTSSAPPSPSPHTSHQRSHTYDSPQSSTPCPPSLSLAPSPLTPSTPSPITPACASPTSPTTPSGVALRLPLPPPPEAMAVSAWSTPREEAEAQLVVRVELPGQAQAWSPTAAAAAAADATAGALLTPRRRAASLAALPAAAFGTLPAAGAQQQQLAHHKRSVSVSSITSITGASLAAVVVASADAGSSSVTLTSADPRAAAAAVAGASAPTSPRLALIDNLAGVIEDTQVLVHRQRPGCLPRFDTSAVAPGPPSSCCVEHAEGEQQQQQQQDGEALTVTEVSSLSAEAATFLHGPDAQGGQRGPAAAAAGALPGGTSSSASSLLLPSPSKAAAADGAAGFAARAAAAGFGGSSSAAAAVAAVAAAAGCFDDDDDDECGVCLEHTAVVAMAPCMHIVCGPCARKLCSLDPQKVCLCPFCRTLVAGFKPKQ